MQFCRWRAAGHRLAPKNLVPPILGLGHAACCLLTQSVNQFSSQANTFHKRELPDSLIALSSGSGRKMFKEALIDGDMESFFPLSEQFLTQSEPAFCALTSLAMVLNALNHDPGKVWKGPWRWVSEEGLQCESEAICGHSLDRVRKEGMTFTQFESLAVCHGVNMKTYRVSDPRLHFQHEQFDGHMESTTRGIAIGVVPSQLDSRHHHDVHCGKHDAEDCQHHHTLHTALSEYALDKIHSHSHHHGDTVSTFVDVLDAAAIHKFREHIKSSCQSSEANKFIITNFSRKSLSQTGDGHFSPIAGYHARSDHVLILDTARFKYAPWFVPLPDLWAAMGVEDQKTGESRGYFVVEKGQ